MLETKLELDAFISDNLGLVHSICKRFEISKNKLYKVFDDFFLSIKEEAVKESKIVKW